MVTGLPELSQDFVGCEEESGSAGGENGFNQAIELSGETLSNVKFVMEKRLISK
jgi:hypothetical protein